MSFSVSVCVLCRFSRTLCNPMDCARQAPLTMGFSRQEDWREWPCPPPGGLLGIFSYFQLPAPWRSTQCQTGHLPPSGHEPSPGPWSSCAHIAW